MGFIQLIRKKIKSAKKFDKLSFDEAYEKQLKIMDMTAFTLMQGK